MDAIRYFKEHAKAARKAGQYNEQTALSLQQVQHRVATDAGFRSWQDLRQAPASEVSIAVTMHLEPSLTSFGFGIFQRRRTRAEHRAEFAEKRAELRDHHQTVHSVQNWLVENIAYRKTLNTAVGSYGLKDRVERTMGTYITNGEFIAAAIAAEYPYRRTYPGSPNAIFGMSQISIKAIPRPR